MTEEQQPIPPEPAPAPEPAPEPEAHDHDWSAWYAYDRHTKYRTCNFSMCREIEKVTV